MAFVKVSANMSIIIKNLNKERRKSNMKYFVAKTNEINPGIESLEWEKAEIGHVDTVNWEGCYPIPETTFKLLRGPEGFSVLMHTNETNLRSEEKSHFGSICSDSCMEFFYKPSPWDERYLNFEVNPEGYMHLGIGSSRFNRTKVEDNREIFDIVSIANDGDWTLKYYVPDSFVQKLYPNLVELSRDNSTSVAKGNFYKCGEKTDHPHYASWNEIPTKKSDFHVPDFFGQIIF